MLRFQGAPGKDDKAAEVEKLRVPRLLQVFLKKERMKVNIPNSQAASRTDMAATLSAESHAYNA